MNHLLQKLFILFFLLCAPHAQAKDYASILDRVQATKTIRCGYIVWEPYVVRDLKTNSINGIAVDYLNAIAAREGYTIDWTSEITIDQVVPSIDAEKIDLFCVPCSPLADFLKVADFVGGFGQLPYYIYVGENSMWSKETIKTAKFAVVDGYIPMIETPKTFPDASIISLPQTTSMAELYDQIKFGKADAIVNEHLTAMNYMKNNPGIIRKFDDQPVAIKPMSFPTKKDDGPWRDYFNKTFSTATSENATLLRSLMNHYDVSEETLFVKEGK